MTLEEMHKQWWIGLMRNEQTGRTLASEVERKVVNFKCNTKEDKQDERKDLNKCATGKENTCINGNTDDLNAAINALNAFTHNWCMDCEATERTGDLHFKCERCTFNDLDRCLVKKFASSNSDNGMIPEDFGCMPR